MDALGIARLSEEIPAHRAVAAVIPREEIVSALDDPEAQPELMLRVILSDGAAHSISIDWSRDDLEGLLSRTSGNTVSLRFDRDELVGAFDDVEAHGIRERALVFTVAAAAALGTGVGAQAMHTPGDGAAAPVASSPATAAVDGSLSPLARSEQISEGFLPSPGARTPSGASEQFLGIDVPSPTDAILVGGVLLTLAGATFAGRRGGTVRPA
jgi:hypothetical protein